MIESNSNTSTTTTTSTTIINHNVKRNNKENQTLTEAMTIPNTLSSQNNLVNSVIQQTNQQSVIQATSGAPIQAIQLPKSIILFNKVNQNSVIQRTENNNEILQNNRMESTGNNNSNLICSPDEVESKRRREMLNRRPSYRKILNDISSADTAGGIISDVPVEAEHNNETQSQNQSSSASTNSSSHIVVSASDTAVLSLTQPVNVNMSSHSNTTVTKTLTDQNNNETTLSTLSYLKMSPSTTMQITTDSELLPATVHLSSHSGPHSQLNHGIVQYASSIPEQQFFISDSLHWPYKVNPNEFSTYPATSPVMINSNNITPNITSSGSNISNVQHRNEEEIDKKRQLRLQKNREAAKECRRKKKEYIKCLEDRVNVLSQQNKTLIEELKTLKKLYCQQND